jgi:hypothetical protein
MNKITDYYKEIQLGDEAYDYFVNEHLPFGISYSKYLIEEISKNKGRISTFLPAIIQDDNLTRFTESIKASIPESFYSELNSTGLKTPNIDPIDEYWVLPLIRTFLQKDKQNLCIIEEHEIIKGDSSLEKSPSHWISYGDEIYYIISGINTSFDSILNVFGWVGSWTFICGLCRLPQKFGLPFSKHSLDEEEIRSLAQNTEKIIISAYDQEGYLVWHKLMEYKHE